MNEESILKEGEVEQIEDSADGLRIKVRIKQDGKTPREKLPYAFPLLPKTFQSVPKVGEGAFIILSKPADKNSQRYYLGPIISQPQYQEMSKHWYGRGESMSLLNGGSVEPLERISNYKETNGAFPKKEDVAVVGRGTQDIVLRKGSKTSNEIDIRCGIRQQSVNGEGRDGNAIVGSVVFNNLDPAYIQLKYKKNITKDRGQNANSIINMVADKINIISNKDPNGFDLTDPDELIKEDELDSIMSKLHQVPHGDTLIKLLKVIIKAITTHVHPYAGMPASLAGDTMELMEWFSKLDDILSKHVRIS